MRPLCLEKSNRLLANLMILENNLRSRIYMRGGGGGHLGLTWKIGKMQEKTT